MNSDQLQIANYERGKLRYRPAKIIKCRNCGNDKLVRKVDNTTVFCSVTCSGAFHKHQSIFSCDWCGKTNSRSYSRTGKTGLRFCNRKCKDEATKYRSGNPKLWAPHYGSIENKIRGDRDKSRKEIANHARNVHDSMGKPYGCCICGYDLITEVAHIKAVSEFNNDDTYATINHIDNLIRLCPNHHREYDNLKIFCICIENWQNGMAPALGAGG